MATFRPLPTADQVHFPLTADGWCVALHRHLPRSRSIGRPVIVCPGYGCNRHFVDFDERYSLARFLAREGFDAWVLELRGRGLSRPTASCRRPRTWTFDDLAGHDLPAAIEHVARITGRRVAWVGHSMGGMLLYAYLGQQVGRDAPVAAGVTIASPVVFPAASSDLFTYIGHLLLQVPFTETVPQRLALGVLWHLLSRTPVLEIGMNPANIDRGIVGRALPRALGNVSRRKLQQLAHWALSGEFCSADRRIDYRAALERVRTPLLVTAGSMDRVATPAAVQRVLEHLPRRSARYREFGRAQGGSIDYGHVDLVLGRAAPDEVFPAIAEWLARNAGES